MNTRRSPRIISAFALMAAVAAMTTATPPEIAQPVSPGSARAFPAIESRCPTFSWTAVDGARGYELVAYLVSEREALLSASANASAAVIHDSRPALRVHLPAKASSWTPSRAQCLVAGESYAWAVRAMKAEGEAEWSDAYLFEVQSAPTEQDVREALETLEGYLEQGGNLGLLHPLLIAAPMASTTQVSPPPTLLPGTIPPILSTAISAEMPDTGPAAATAGIEARSNSASGVAAVAQNTAGGQIASFQNATQEVAKIAGDGTVEAVAFIGDGSGLTNLPGGGGGGTSSIAKFAVSDDLSLATPGPVLTTTLDPPAAGTLLISANVDIFAITSDLVTCELKVDNVIVPGSTTNSETTFDVDNSEEDCTTFGAIAVDDASHTIEFVVTFDNTASEGSRLTAGTLWALWVPAAP